MNYWISVPPDLLQKIFILKYRKLLTYATLRDRKGAYEMSVQLGYLTGLESQSMKDAHVDSVLTLGEPFRGDVDKSFDFKDQTVSDRIRGNIGLMLNERHMSAFQRKHTRYIENLVAFFFCVQEWVRLFIVQSFLKRFLPIKFKILPRYLYICISLYYERYFFIYF